ncbi:hypothetical protein EJB05_16156, partial [Eragrostis curvula]
MDGNSTGATLSWLGIDPNSGRGRGGATAVPRSGPRSGRGAAAVGGGTAGAAVSGSSAAADGGHFFSSNVSPTLGNHGRTSAPSSMGGFPLDFSNSWDAAPRLVDVASDSPPVTPTQHASTAEEQTVNVDSGDEIVRTDKPILWTPDEDERLMSAWVNNSMDPINGNDKRNEQYWADVVETYNLTTPKHRKRIRNEPKWVRVTYNKGLKNARKRKESDMEESNGSIDEGKHDVDCPLPRPIGKKKAKKMMYEGKSTKSATEVIELDKFEKIQSDAHENRLKVLEMQQKLSAEKVESSKIAQLAAKEQKEARKLELEARMMETFTLLSKQDKEKMSDEEKAEHVLTLKCLRKRLFPEITNLD